MTRDTSTSPKQLLELEFEAPKVHQCMLMSADDRYISYHLTVDWDTQEVTITRADTGARSKVISYNLMETHICSIDSANEKNISPEGGMYCVNLQHKKSRKIYFITY